jgi:hypothetical protein
MDITEQYWLENAMKEKGLKYDIFEPMTSFMSALDEAREKILVQYVNMDANLKKLTNNGSYYNPVDTFEIDKLCIEKIHMFTKMIICEAEKRFANLKINSSEVEQYVRVNMIKEDHPFDANEIMLFIFKKYYDDEDAITFAQLQAKVKNALPYVKDGEWSSHRARNPAEVPRSSVKSLEFEDLDGDEIEAVTQFAGIVIGNVMPSKAAKWNRLGNKIVTNYVNVTIFKNGKVPVKFKSSAELEAFCNALFIPPEEILSVR